MKRITFEHVTFNADWAKTKSEAEFIEHEKHHFEGDPNAEAKLKEAYQLATKSDNPPKPAKPGK